MTRNECHLTSPPLHPYSNAMQLVFVFVFVFSLSLYLYLCFLCLCLCESHLTPPPLHPYSRAVQLRGLPAGVEHPVEGQVSCWVRLHLGAVGGNCLSIFKANTYG